MKESNTEYHSIPSIYYTFTYHVYKPENYNCSQNVQVVPISMCSQRPEQLFT